MKRNEELGNLEEHLSKAIENINNDRAVTSTLLTDVLIYIKQNEQNHKEVGQIAAKYVETLQRSNEQLVKICTILHKKDSGHASLTEKDKNELFDMINKDSV
jgi:hypothetical protein|tara:strand:+ start:2857 stop:3162 length:306 start_codon:yes stop_codon:yes gene_type:complete